MASPVLVPCLVALRSEVNQLAPDRDKTTDGWIGNKPHQLTVSDHNDDEVGKVPIRDADSVHEVHALDLDADLRAPGLSMTAIVLHIVRRCVSGAENRLRYIIWNRTIWSATDEWAPRPYTGDSPHTEHAHFSASYSPSREADTRSWRLEEIPVALTEADKKWLSDKIDRAATAAAERVWSTKRNIERAPGRPIYLAEMGAIVANIPAEHGTIRDYVDNDPTNDPGGKPATS